MKHIVYSDLTKRFYHYVNGNKIDITDDIKEIVDFLRPEPTPSVSAEEVQKAAIKYCNEFHRGGSRTYIKCYNSFLEGFDFASRKPAGEGYSSIAPTDLRIKEKAEEFLSEYASDFPPGNATCFAAGAKWMKDMLLTSPTPSNWIEIKEGEKG